MPVKFEKYVSPQLIALLAKKNPDYSDQKKISGLLLQRSSLLTIDKILDLDLPWEVKERLWEDTKGQIADIVKVYGLIE